MKKFMLFLLLTSTSLVFCSDHYKSELISYHTVGKNMHSKLLSYNELPTLLGSTLIYALLRSNKQCSIAKYIALAGMLKSTAACIFHYMAKNAYQELKENTEKTEVGEV